LNKTGKTVVKRKKRSIGYNKNMYTKFDHKKKNYYTIQENKENKIKHNTGINV
jgi:hypothetical protein